MAHGRAFHPRFRSRRIPRGPRIAATPKGGLRTRDSKPRVFGTKPPRSRLASERSRLFAPRTSLRTPPPAAPNPREAPQPRACPHRRRGARSRIIWPRECTSGPVSLFFRSIVRAHARRLAPSVCDFGQADSKRRVSAKHLEVRGLSPERAPKGARFVKGRQPLTGLGCALCLELAALAAPPSARSWGCEGHQIVALVAERHLSVHAQREVAALLGPLDTVRRQEEVPRRKSRGRGCNVDLDAFARASIWADEIRASRPATASWHFLDIPRGTKDARKAESFCGRSGCVTRAIREQVAILQGEGANPAQRAEALRFVIHFVG